LIGPNRLFLDYISQVCHLGERSVVQATVESLLGRYRIEALTRRGPPQVDARMAVVDPQ